MRLADREESLINFFAGDNSRQKNFTPWGSSDQSATLTDLKEWYQNAIDSSRCRQQGTLMLPC
jgi:hypothetical protein